MELAIVMLVAFLWLSCAILCIGLLSVIVYKVSASVPITVTVILCAVMLILYLSLDD